VWLQGTARMWPYTYMDCEFNWVYNLGGKGYCDGGKPNFPCGTCQNACNKQWVGTFGRQRSEMEMHIQEMADAIQLCAASFVFFVPLEKNMILTLEPCAAVPCPV
jgi:hypothetical protein